MYIDEKEIIPQFYCNLHENAEKLSLLEAKLQEEYTGPLGAQKFTYVNKISDLKVGDKLEALYEVDNKWYRVCVRSICLKTQQVNVFFLDFGNSQMFDASSDQFKKSKQLRFRNTYDNYDESKAFNIEYQAIRCRFVDKSRKPLPIADLVNKLADLDVENGIKFKVVTILDNDYDSDKFELSRITYGVLIDDGQSKEKSVKLDETITDQEVSSILEESQVEIKKPVASYQPIKKDSSFYSIFNIKSSLTDYTLSMNKNYHVSILHVESTSEFYVQLSDFVKRSFDHQNQIQAMLEKYSKMTSGKQQANKQHKVGEFLFAKYSLDEVWYRGLITNVTKSQESNEEPIDDNDGYLYEIYYVDFGNTEKNITSASLCSVETLLSSNPSEAFHKEVEALVKFPFAAVCCELKNKKESKRNTEILKTMIGDYLDLNIVINDSGNHKIWLNNVEKTFEIKKYTVNLYCEDEILNKKFESVEEMAIKPPKEEAKKLESSFSSVVSSKSSRSETNPLVLKRGSQHECKIAFFGENADIYVNLLKDVDLLARLEADLDEYNKTVLNNKSLVNFWDKTQPNVGDLVLAKFRPDENNNEFNWCRAVVTKILNKNNKNTYQVFYIDYGNDTGDLYLIDLIKLPKEFDLSVYPVFAHYVQLNETKIDIESMGVELSDFFLDTFKIKVLDFLKEDPITGTLKYNVEIWSNDFKKCLNTIVNDKYVAKSIEIEIDSPRSSSKILKSIPNAIESVSIEKSFNQTALKVVSKYIFVDNFAKPFYFCHGDDFEKREELKADLNEFYSKSNKNSAELSVNNYCAAFSEGDWYRAKITLIDDNIVHLFYIDFGFEEKVPLSDAKARVIHLNEKFYKIPKLAFGCFLVVPSNKKAVIEFKEEDETELAPVLEDFIAASSDEYEISIHCKLNQFFVENLKDETFFGVVLHSPTGISLNESLCAKLEAIKKKKLDALKIKRPPLIKLNEEHLPKQNQDLNLKKNEKFMSFVQRLDLFYIFNKIQVRYIQKKVQEICHKIISEEKTFDAESTESSNASNPPSIGDLVFGKYHDDEAWYRCIITNCSTSDNKYELFFIDFGNTEVTSRAEILYGWDEEHVSVFKSFEPQAYKCKLYGVLPTTDNELSKAQTLAFKGLISNKLLNPKLIKINQDNMYEVSLNVLNDDSTRGDSIHYSLVEKRIVELAKFNDVLLNINTKEEVEFYTDMLNMLFTKKTIL